MRAKSWLLTQTAFLSLPVKEGKLQLTVDELVSLMEDYRSREFLEHKHDIGCGYNYLTGHEMGGM